MNLEGVFTLVSLMDGTTLNGFLRVEGTPLVQRYTTGTDNYVPDFEKLADDKKPTVVPILRDITSGELNVPNTLTWRYNGVEIHFGPDGLSTDEAFKGFFKKLSHPVTVDGQSVQLPSMRVMKNLVKISGYDNDRISVSGTVEINGQSVPFTEMSKEVVIQETTGNAYDVLINDDKGGALATKGESLTCTAYLYKDGLEITDYQNYRFQWVKLLGKGDENWGAARTQKVTTADIDNVLKLRCDVYQADVVIASGFTQISDFSDPYYADFQITGITGNYIGKNQTAKVKPVARRRSDGQINELVKNWKWNIIDNAGKPFIIAGQEGATFTAETIDVKKADTDKAGGGLSGSVSTSF